MADEQTTQDEIISIALQLKTNFAKELLNANTQLNRFGDRASAVSKQAVGSLESLNRQLATTMNSMMEGTANEMQQLVSAISNQTGILESRNKAFAQRQIKYAQDLKREYDDVYTYLNRVSNTLANIDRRKSGPLERDKATGRIKPRWSIEDVKNHTFLRDQLKGKIESFEALVKDANARLISDSIGLIKQNVTNLTTASVRALEFVGRTSDDVLKKITQARIASQHMTDTPMLIKRAQSLMEAKEGRGALSSLYRDQAARLGVLGRSRREIEALAKTVPVADEKTPEAVRIANDQLRQSYVDTIMVVRKLEEQTRASMTGMRPHIQAVNRAVKELNLEMIANGKRAGISLKQAVPGESQIKGLYGNLMKSYGEMILSSTNTTDAAFVDATKNSRVLQTEIDKTIAKLKAQGREADRLKKTGFLPEDAYSSIKSNIADRLADVERLSVKVQQVQKDFRQLAMPKDFQKLTSMAGVDKAAMSMEAQQTRLASFGRVNMTNFPSAVSTLNAAKKAQDELEAQIIKSQKNITAITSLETRARLAAETETDEGIKAKYTALADRMVAITASMVANINAANKKRIDLTPKFAEIRAVAGGVEAKAQQTVPNVEAMKTRFNEIHKLYDDFTLYQQTTMRKWFVGEGTRSAAQQMYNQIRSQVDAYKAELTRLVKIHNELVQVQRTGQGTPLTSQLIANTKATIDGMRNSMLELNRVNDQAGKKMEMVQQKTIAGAISSGWNLVRNFRWQTAALGYFIYAAVNNVKRFVVGVFDEIYEFRKGALALAAQFSYQMIGDVKENFDQAYAYSRNLMVQMQVVAAKTSLSMEDMINLVRTFAQAGIVPKGTEDLEKIAAIGTAIQAVTEGMANAGTQMKQELNALILGRQRATDSLAMMFQFMGVNIKDLMKKAKEEGANMLDVFSAALKPFNEMMGRMKDEWGAVKNRIDIAWESMKRFALEGFLQNLAKNLGGMIGQYFDEATGTLTQAGKEIAQVIRGVYETTASVLGLIFNVAGSILGVFNMLLNTAYDLKTALTGVAGTSQEITGKYRGLLGLFQEILGVVWLINHTIAAMVNIIKLPIVTLISLVETARGAGQWLGGRTVSLFTGRESEQQKKGADRMKRAWDDVAKASADVWNLPVNAQKDLNMLENTFKTIRDMSKETKDYVGSLATFKLPVDIKTIGDSVKALEKHFETKGISDSTIRSLAEGIGGYVDSVKGEIKQVAKANDEVEAAIAEAAKQYNISADIIRAVAWKESRYNPKAVSSAGAQGIMQIMPETGKGLGLEDPFNIQQNIMAGAKYLRQMMDRYGNDLQLALAAYNAGPGNVDKAGGIPKIAETLEYVRDLTGQTDRIINTLGIDIEKLASKGPALFAEQAKNAKEEFALVEEGLKKNIISIDELLQAADFGMGKMSSENYKYRVEQKKGFQDMIARIRVYYALIDAEEKSKTAKYLDAEAKKEAHEKSAFQKLTQDLAGKPSTIGDELSTYQEEMKRKIDEIIASSKYAAENSSILWKAYTDGSIAYWAKLVKESDDAFTAFMDRVASHKPKTEFQTIRDEFTKLRDEFEKLSKAKGYDETKVSGERQLINLFEEERIKLAKINVEHEVMVKQIDTQIKKNEYLAGSYSPLIQQEAARNVLVLNYTKEMAEVGKAVQDIDAKWKDLNGNWRNVEGVGYMKQMRAAYEESVVYMQMIFEREFFRKQHPLWAQIVEMSKGWADGMTDAISDVIDQTKTMKDAFKDLQKQILKDFSKAVIKQYITNPIMGMLGSGEPGSPTMAQKMGVTSAPTSATAMEEAKKLAQKTAGGMIGGKGMGAMDALIASGKPVPVYIVADPNQVLEKAGEEAKRVTEEVTDAVKETNQAIEDGTANDKSFFGQLMAMLISMKAFMAGGGVSGSKGGFGGLFDSISGMFGGGGPEQLSGPGMGEGSSGGGFGDFLSGLFGGGSGGGLFGGSGGAGLTGIGELGAVAAFADGGIINEQIVGKGLQSGATYTFGERTPYGQNEMIAPIDQLAAKFQSGGTGMSMQVHMPVNIQAIDTQSGAEFLMKNSALLESTMIKSIRNNRRIRDAIRGS